jgi:hypothetical protein
MEDRPVYLLNGVKNGIPAEMLQIFPFLPFYYFDLFHNCPFMDYG